MSIHKRGSSYQVKYRTSMGQKSRTFKVLKDAKAFEQQVIRDRQTRGLVLVDRGTVTVAEWADRWWKEKAHEWSAGTERQYRSEYTRFVYPLIGGYQLREVTPGLIQDWKTELAHVPAPTLKKTMAMLSGMFRAAVLHGEIETNPLREVAKPQVRKRLAPSPFSPVEIETFRDRLDHRDATLVSVLGYMGLRPGEALRLRWDDIGEQAVRVRDTKRERERPGLLLPPVAQDLRDYKLATGLRDGVVFPGVDWANWRKRVWNPLVKDLYGVDGMLPKGFDRRPYRLRSSFVSLLLADNDYPLPLIAMYHGSSLEVISKYYAGLIAEFQGRGVSAVQEIRKARLKRAA